MGRRGYTLLELSIVIGLAILLTTAIAAAIQGSMTAARTHRTGQEMSGLAGAAAATLKRNLTGDTSGWFFNGAPFSVKTPLCYDLAQGTCPSGTGLPWQNTYYSGISKAPPNFPLLALLSGQGYGKGYNPWCVPYVACLYPTRAEIVTCVPNDEVGAIGLESALDCGTCNVMNDARCVLLGTSAFNLSTAQSRLSLATDELDKAGSTDAYDMTPDTFPTY